MLQRMSAAYNELDVLVDHDDLIVNSKRQVMQNCKTMFFFLL